VPGGRGGPGGYLAGYASFFVAAAVFVTVSHLRRPYRVVQVNTLPDVLVFAAAVPHLLGARVLLDLQECMPEFFAAKFGTGMRHPAVRLIAALEQRSIGFADLVITPTELLRGAFVARGADPVKVGVVMDGADEDVFRRLPPGWRDPQLFTLVSHGTIHERYGLDTAIEAVALLRDEIPGVQLKIYGDGPDVTRLRSLAAELAVADRIHFSAGFVPFGQLVHGLASADVGLVAMKRDPFRDLTLAGKMFDFIEMRLPMAVSRTRSVAESFEPGCFELFDSGEPASLAGAIRRLHADPDRRARLADRAFASTEPYRWRNQRRRYLSTVGRLLDAPDPRARTTGRHRRRSWLHA
jgi:glycosyltransferase involved in cell wall biosynthesis